MSFASDNCMGTILIFSRQPRDGFYCKSGIYRKVVFINSDGEKILNVRYLRDRMLVLNLR